MLKCEVISTAISVLLSRFKVLRKVCYYENGCNMSKAVILSFPWVNEDCLIICDRFHYRAHACNSNWDPESCLSYRNHSSSRGEAINQLWVCSKSHLRFQKTENDMPFSMARFVFINLCALIRRRQKKADINSQMFRRTIRGMWNCECQRCSE